MIYKYICQGFHLFLLCFRKFIKTKIKPEWTDKQKKFILFTSDSLLSLPIDINLMAFGFDIRVADNLSANLLNKSLMACTGRGDLSIDRTTQRCHEYIYTLKRDLYFALRSFKSILLKLGETDCYLGSTVYSQRLKFYARLGR